MRNLTWSAIAWLATRPRVTAWIIRRAQRTPYYNIHGPDGSLYMGRWWLFNPYGKDATGETLPARWPWLPSIRVHHIMRPDSDRHLHDHPWNARTIVLRGWYAEERPWDSLDDDEVTAVDGMASVPGQVRGIFYRSAGYTGRLLFGQYHRISQVPVDGVWTLFFTWRKRGTWGFDVQGQKVPWREYLEDHPAR